MSDSSFITLAFVGQAAIILGVAFYTGYLDGLDGAGLGLSLLKVNTRLNQEA